MPYASVLLLLAAAQSPPPPPACTEPLQANTKSLGPFLRAGCPEKLGWKQDAAIRSTGPVISGVSFDTHGVVKVYYSPEVYQWLSAGRPKSGIPDGGFLVKASYSGSDVSQPGAVAGWVYMFKQRSLSFDGWLWGWIDANNQASDSGQTFVGYCVACHASADNPEITFASLNNITGKDIRTYANVQATGRIFATAPPAVLNLAHNGAVSIDLRQLPRPLDIPDPAFLKLFPFATPPATAQALPNSVYDHVPAGPKGPGQFLTSDLCGGCHDADSLLHSKQPDMLLRRTVAGQTGNLNLSPYGEWSTSMMGLSGRDPVFHAQLASERAAHPELAGALDNLCFRCHGVMGQRQLALDTAPNPRPFLHRMIYATPDTDPANAKYGALARDGVSCAVCHHMRPQPQVEDSFTGNFAVGPPQEIYGPYRDDVKPYPMEQSLGITPQYDTQHDGFIAGSDLCGSCHVVQPPVLDVNRKYTPAEFQKAPKTSEQTTYMEWRNSSFWSADAKSKTAQTCQQCHMPRTAPGSDQPLALRIANIQDERYPQADNLAPLPRIALPGRRPFSRHTLVAANLFVMAMFQQFPNLLGITTEDGNIATGAVNPVESLLLSAQEALTQAQRETAKVRIVSLTRTAADLVAEVEVGNLAGHKLPSGVGFRRAFLEFQVIGLGSQTLWISGGTSGLGVILDGKGQPLDTEFSASRLQPHYTTISRQDQAQIYEERVKDNLGRLTTSFLALAQEVKDNRLLPRGWRLDGPFAGVTEPCQFDQTSNRCAKLNDPSYFDGQGHHRITYRVPLKEIPAATFVILTLYYQSIPPYYLQDRFKTSSPESERLYYITSRLNLEGTPIENWKLPLTSTTSAIPNEPRP